MHEKISSSSSDGINKLPSRCCKMLTHCNYITRVCKSLVCKKKRKLVGGSHSENMLLQRGNAIYICIYILSDIERKIVIVGTY